VHRLSRFADQLVDQIELVGLPPHRRDRAAMPWNAEACGAGLPRARAEASLSAAIANQASVAD